MFYAAFAITLGMILLTCSRKVVAWTVSRRANRLHELHNGHAEEFFEERRSLEAYSLRFPPFVVRVFGCAWVIVGIVWAVRVGN